MNWLKRFYIILKKRRNRDYNLQDNRPEYLYMQNDNGLWEIYKFCYFDKSTKKFNYYTTSKIYKDELSAHNAINELLKTPFSANRTLACQYTGK